MIEELLYQRPAAPVTFHVLLFDLSVDALSDVFLSARFSHLFLQSCSFQFAFSSLFFPIRSFPGVFAANSLQIRCRTFLQRAGSHCLPSQGEMREPQETQRPRYRSGICRRHGVRKRRLSEPGQARRPHRPPADAKAATPAPAKSADKITLVYKAKKDLIARYKNTSELNIEVSGMKIKAESTSSERVTVTDVAAGGNITFEQQTESQERMANGQKQPAEDLSKSKSTFVVTPDGTLVSLKEADSDDTKEAVREYVANSVVFPKTAVGVGDKWSHDYKASDIGQRDAHADFEVIASETKAGVDTFKIKMEFKETSGAKPLHVTGTYSVEKSSGDTVESDATVENMAFGGADAITANGKMHSERTSGSPFDLEKSNASKPETKTIDDTVKGFEKLPGMFTLYRKKRRARHHLRRDQAGPTGKADAAGGDGQYGNIVGDCGGRPDQ